MGNPSIKGMAKRFLWALAGILFGAWGLLWRRPFARRATPPLDRVGSILVIRLDLVGDVVLTLPAIDAVRRAAPQARITALVLPYTADLLRGHPAVDRVVAVDVNRWRSPAAWLGGGAWRDFRRALRELRAERYDLAISFYGRSGAAAALLSGARHLVGYRSEGYAFTFDTGVSGRRYLRRRHESEYCLDLVRAIGAQGPVAVARPVVDGAASSKAEALLIAAGIGPHEKMAALHPGALTLAAKRWLPERWAAVADRVQSELGCRMVLVGSASERPLADQVRRAMRSQPVVLAGKTSVAELVALLARCSLFLGGDSGPLHVASALGIPSVSVYGPTDPAITGPLGANARVLCSQVECSPCYDPRRPSGCTRGDLRCMDAVTVDEVFAAAKKSLTNTQPPTPNPHQEDPRRQARRHRRPADRLPCPGGVALCPSRGGDHGPGDPADGLDAPGCRPRRPGDGDG